MANFDKNTDQVVQELVINTQSSSKMRVDSSNEDLLFKVLVKNLYSNPKGTLIREYVSNAYDAQIENGNGDDAIIVSLQENEDEELVFSVEDFGIGISPERAKVMSQMLSSTKRGDKTQHGYYGLGSKSGLAYSNIVEIHSHNEGKYYFYIMRITKQGGASFDLVNTSDIDLDDEDSKRNGTEIRIQVDAGDFTSFVREMRSQLGYFDNIFFEVPGFDNDYKIYEADYFLSNSLYTSDISGLEVNSELHAVIGKVKYRINWEEIGIPRIDVPIGVKFDLNDIPVTPNREDIMYNDDVNELIKENIRLALIELVEIGIPRIRPYSDIQDFINNNQYSKFFTIPVTEAMVNTQQLVENHLISQDVKEVFENAKYIEKLGFNLNGKTGYGSLMLEFSRYKWIKGGRAIQADENLMTYSDIFNKEAVYVLDKEQTLKSKINRYLSTLHIDPVTNKSKPILIIRKNKKKGNLDYYKTRLNLRQYPKRSWRNMIVQYQNYIEEWIKNNVKNYDDVIIPPDFDKKDYINRNKLRKEMGKVLIKRLRSSEKGDGYVFDKEERFISGLSSAPLVIYGTDEDQDALKQFADLLKFRNSTRYDNRNNYLELITITKSKLKHLQNRPNFITIDDMLSETYKIPTETEIEKRQLKGTQRSIKQINTELIMRDLLAANLKDVSFEQGYSSYSTRATFEVLGKFILKIYDFERIYLPSRKLFRFFNKENLNSMEKMFKFIDPKSITDLTNWTIIEREMLTNALVEGNYDEEIINNVRFDLEILKKLLPACYIHFLIDSGRREISTDAKSKINIFLAQSYYKEGILLQRKVKS